MEILITVGILIIFYIISLFLPPKDEDNPLEESRMQQRMQGKLVYKKQKKSRRILSPYQKNARRKRFNGFETAVRIILTMISGVATLFIPFYVPVVGLLISFLIWIYFIPSIWK